MGKFDKDIRSWRGMIAKNRARALRLFKGRHTGDGRDRIEVRKEISFLRAQSERLGRFIRDYRGRRADVLTPEQK